MYPLSVLVCLSISVLKQGSVNPGQHAAMVSKFCTVASHTCHQYGTDFISPSWCL